VKDPVALNNGMRMPLLGLGVWQVRDGTEAENAVRWALEAGYRHIDTAQAYGNEESVGKALRASGVPRSEVFITTKFYPRAKKDPAEEAKKSAERLGVDQIDLYLIHWPQGGPTWAWPGMQKAVEGGVVKAIGISNFNTVEMDALWAVAELKPVVNQVQFGPFRYRRGLLEKCKKEGVVLESYSPLNSSRLKDKDLKRIAEAHQRSVPQIILRWVVQHGIPIIPKSVHRDRIEENARVFDFELTAEEMLTLDALDETGGTSEAQESKWW